MELIWIGSLFTMIGLRPIDFTALSFVYIVVWILSRRDVLKLKGTLRLLSHIKLLILRFAILNISILNDIGRKIVCFIIGFLMLLVHLSLAWLKVHSFICILSNNLRSFTRAGTKKTLPASASCALLYLARFGQHHEEKIDS